MANNTLNTRIVICNDTTANWGTSQKVILKGEYAIEFRENGEPKVKIGNGVDTFANLPYITNTPTEITNAINSAVNAANHTHSNKAILDAITASFTTGLKSNYDAAFNHSKTAHAPSNAQANVIETVKVNGATLTPNEKAVDVTVPTKVSQLSNDTGFITSYKDTTYKLGTPASATNGNATLDLTNNLDSSKQSIVVKGAGATKVTTDANGAIVITSSDTDTKYSHPNSGVGAGTYKSVTVNAQGHVTAGSNPTTLAGFGISDAYTKSQTDSKISSAVANAGHLKRSIVSALPEVAKADEHTIYMVAKAAGAVGSGDYNGYDEYMLVISGDTKKFEKIGDSAVDLTNYATKAYADQSEADALSAAKTYANGLAKNYATAAQGTKADSAVQSVKIGTTEYKSGTTVTLPAYPTTLPASDVKDWAKAATKPTYTKSEVGLGNVDNTADANKSVKYATSAGSATSAGTATKLQTYKQGSTTETYGTQYPLYAQWIDGSNVKLKVDNYSVRVNYADSAGNASKVNNHTVDSNVPSGAKFTDTVYSHPTTSGNKHIPSGGSSGQILRWSSDGTAVWGNDNNTTYTLSSITGTLAVSKGGTGSTTAAGGRSNLGAVGFVCQSAEPSGQNNGDLWFKEG